MTRKVLPMLGLTAVACGTVWALGAPAARVLTRSELEQAVGGNIVYCSVPVSNPAGMTCPNCRNTTNPGPSYDCYLTSGSWPMAQSCPANNWSGPQPSPTCYFINTVACPGTERRYKFPNCGTYEMDTGACSTQYASGYAYINAPGVNCP